MITLDSGNVLLKPSHRRQLMNWLKRALRFNQRLGDAPISIRMQRTGNRVEMKANLADRGRGTVDLRSRQHDWRDAARELIHQLTTYLHDQMRLQIMA